MLLFVPFIWYSWKWSVLSTWMWICGKVVRSIICFDGWNLSVISLYRRQKRMPVRIRIHVIRHSVSACISCFYMIVSTMFLSCLRDQWRLFNHATKHLRPMARVTPSRLVLIETLSDVVLLWLILSSWRCRVLHNNHITYVWLTSLSCMICW